MFPAHRVVFVVFAGVQALDLTGPAEVFACANRVLGRTHYQVTVASPTGGKLTTSAGVPIVSTLLAAVKTDRNTTVLACGAERLALLRALASGIPGWLTKAAPRAQRFGSICSGAFLLGQAGLLTDKDVTTHWDGTTELAKHFPRARVDRNSLYVIDGKLWTSAGVTAGIDMALAMVEQDLGAKVADQIASRLVLYCRRPGYQSQWSDALIAQQQRSDPFADAISWVRANLPRADLASLAKHSAMSLRSLHRHCVAVLGVTPAKLLDRIRVEHARTLLASTARSTKTIASVCGWTSLARMTRAFARELGVTPLQYRLLHSRER